jgi:hypothetical protein
MVSTENGLSHLWSPRSLDVFRRLVGFARAGTRRSSAEVPAAKMGLEDTWPMGFQHALLESNPKIDRKVGNCNEGNILLGGLSHLVNGL